MSVVEDAYVQSRGTSLQLVATDDIAVEWAARRASLGEAARDAADQVWAVSGQLVAALMLVALLPVLLLIALAVKVASPGPALFRQVRVGQDGRNFTMWKFRSMHVGADMAVDDLRDMNDHDGVLFKIRNDPRIYPLGRQLRRFSLDELPQLWNVVRGDMALVGPRPALPSEVALYNAFEAKRLAVKPGLTGLWQVSGRSELSWERSIQLDIEYVNSKSVARDLQIVAKTFGAVVTARGAY